MAAGSAAAVLAGWQLQGAVAATAAGAAGAFACGRLSSQPNKVKQITRLKLVVNIARMLFPRGEANLRPILEQPRQSGTKLSQAG
jgi:hypothetical protein